MSALDRALVTAFTIFTAGTGALLIVEPHTFYTNIPGVATSDPFNGHLLRDVGLAYATLAFGAVFALRHPSNARTVMAMAAIYLLGHAALHAFMEVSSANTGAAIAEAPATGYAAIQPNRRSRTINDHVLGRFPCLARSCIPIDRFPHTGECLRRFDYPDDAV